jgi:hypothetical protein
MSVKAEIYWLAAELAALPAELAEEAAALAAELAAAASAGAAAVAVLAAMAAVSAEVAAELAASAAASSFFWQAASESALMAKPATTAMRRVLEVMVIVSLWRCSSVADGRRARRGLRRPAVR